MLNTLFPSLQTRLYIKNCRLTLFAALNQDFLKRATEHIAQMHKHTINDNI